MSHFSGQFYLFSTALPKKFYYENFKTIITTFQQLIKCVANLDLLFFSWKGEGL